MNWDEFDETCMRFDNCEACPYYNATKNECELRSQDEEVVEE